MDWWQIIKDVVTFIGVATGIGISLANRKKINADTKSVDAATTDRLVETAMQFVEPLKRELAEERRKRVELETKVSTMATEMEEMRWRAARLMAGVTQLVYQVKSIGHTPVFDPDVDMQKKPGGQA